MNIILRALRLLERVTGYAGRARQFYYEIMLLGHVCPRCGGKPSMVHEGWCRCGACGNQFDPTVAFLRCPACGGETGLNVRRYSCVRCGNNVVSKFLFDGLVFDKEYFRQHMAESRRRQRDKREEVRKMLANSRSPVMEIGGADLNAVPGLMEALNALASGGIEDCIGWRPSESFDLKRYQRHIQGHLGDFPVSLEEIPQLLEDARKDRIWRFVALIFLEHEGIVVLRQEGPMILVMRHDDAKRHDILEGVEEPDGLERPLGRAQAW